MLLYWIDICFYIERGGYYYIVNDMNIKFMVNLDYEYKNKIKIVDIGSKFVEYLGKLYNFEMICWFSKKMVRILCIYIKK